jgi:hypothetical protein
LVRGLGAARAAACCPGVRPSHACFGSLDVRGTDLTLVAGRIELQRPRRSARRPALNPATPQSAPSLQAISDSATPNRPSARNERPGSSGRHLRRAAGRPLRAHEPFDFDARDFRIHRRPEGTTSIKRLLVSGCEEGFPMIREPTSLGPRDDRAASAVESPSTASTAERRPSAERRSQPARIVGSVLGIRPPPDLGDRAPVVRQWTAGPQRLSAIVSGTGDKGFGRPKPACSSGFRLVRAEGEGFEPSRDETAPNGFRDRRIRPLCHPSEVRGIG